MSERTTTVTPEERWRIPIGVETVSSSMPGWIGAWKWKSCSPWRIMPSSSCGITESAAMPIAWNAGTIEKTGGASSPEACLFDRVVRGGGVRGDALLLDAELDGLGGFADRVGLESGGGVGCHGARP